MKALARYPVRVRNGLYIAAALGVLYVLFRFLLHFILPFVIALALARLIEPGVQYLNGRRRVPRKAGAVLLTALLASLLLASAVWLLSCLLGEANDFIARTPLLLVRLKEFENTLTLWIDACIEAAPDAMRALLHASADSLLEGIASIPAALLPKLAGWGASFAAAAPSALFFICAVVLSTVLISSDYPDIIRRLLSPFSKEIRGKILIVKTQVFITLGKWLRAQALLSFITFCGLLAGFAVLGVKPALLPALLISLIDALPVLGTGICLLPWAAMCMLSGDTFRAVGLAVLYGTVVLVRGFAEPKLVGAQIGLGALPTFMSMYIGFMAAGVAGMLLSPLLLITGKQAWEAFHK